LLDVLFSVLVDGTWNIFAQSYDFSTINIQWLKYQINNVKSATKVTKYIALCFPKMVPRNISAWTTDGDSTSVEVKNLTVNTDYIVQVLAILDNDNQTWKSSFPDRNKTIRASQQVIVTTTKNGKH
jgi:hypothetical protein